MGKNTRKTKLSNIHPGEVLREEFLGPLGITAYRLSRETGISQTRISLILREQRAITADTALRFAAFFGTSAKFWLGLQEDYNLEAARNRLGENLERIRPLPLPVPAP